MCPGPFHRCFHYLQDITHSVKVIACVLSLFDAVSAVTYITGVLARDDYAKFSEYSRTIMKIMCGMHIVRLICNILLFVSAFMKKRVLALPWLLVAALSWIFVVITIICFIKEDDGIKDHVKVFSILWIQLLCVTVFYERVVRFYIQTKDGRGSEEPEEGTTNETQPD